MNRKSVNVKKSVNIKKQINNYTINGIHFLHGRAARASGKESGVAGGQLTTFLCFLRERVCQLA